MKNIKKRIAAFLLILCVFAPDFSALLSYAAGFSGGLNGFTGGFPDVQDENISTAAEALRLMGVLDGYEDGLFHPENTLTRAQFCKMVVNFIGADDELERYAAFTIFPDVKPSHWAAGYINLAARGKKIIAGYADGYFHPEYSVTLGHAVTILLRLLGYQDKDIGGIWPDGFIAQARSIKLLENIDRNISGNDNLTRGQTAIIFKNLLKANNSAGSALFNLSEETTLTSLDGGAKKMVTSDKTYDMDQSRDSTFFINNRGRVVLRDNNALTFLPVENANIITPSSGAVIISSGGANSSAALSALTGNRTGYNIYKNGLPIGPSDLKSGDVAIYSSISNAVLVCDTRLTAYYENCYPSPSAPSTIELLNGTVFNVLPTAVDSVARFRPGKVATFLLSADGQIAGAISDDGSGNAIALIGNKGTTRLLCGTTEIPLKASASGNAGQPVNIMSDEKNNIYFNPLRNNINGDLDLNNKTFGSRKLAANIRFFDGDGAVSMDQIKQDVISAAEIIGVHTNWAGDVDMVIFGTNTTLATWYGKAVVTIREGKYYTPVEDDSDDSEENKTDDSSNNPAFSPTPTSSSSSHSFTDYSETYTRMLTIVYGDGKSVGPAVNPIRDVKNGEYLAVQLNRAGDRYTSIRTMQKLANISFDSWVGKTAVTYGNRTYTVSESVPCYNRDTNRWVTLETARVYAERADLYIADGAVRIVEIGEQ